MMDLAVKKKHPANLHSHVPITRSLCHSNPLGCHGPERSSNGNAGRAERAWAKPKATTDTHEVCQSVYPSVGFILGLDALDVYQDAFSAVFVLDTNQIPE